MKRILLVVFLLLNATSNTFLMAQSADIRLLRKIQSMDSQQTDLLFQYISDSHIYIIAATPLAMGATALLTHDDQLLEHTIELGAATALNMGMTYLLKYSINRDRPSATYLDIIPKSQEGSPSFPSGHTSSSFATATSLSLMYPEWYVIAPCFAWAGAVGYSRMYLGVHYPSDVAAGALLGIGSAWLSHRANQWYRTKQKAKHGKFE